MSLDYILRRFAQKTGIACYPTTQRNADDEQKLYALDIINEAAEETWESCDIRESLRECVLLMYQDRQLSLPSFVGKLRGIREYNTEVEWKLSTVRPRYVQNSWADQEVANWRDKGVSPLYRTFLNVSPLTFSVDTVEAEPIVITVVGSNSASKRVEYSITMDAVEKTATVQLDTIESIRKNRLNDYNVIVTDGDDTELAVIYNDELESHYRVVDCAEFGFAQSDTNQYIPVEILYKIHLKRLVEDTDEFPVQGFDHVILNRALQLYFEEKGNIKAAVAFDKKAERTTQRKNQDFNSGKTITVEPEEHPHSMMFSRIRTRYHRYMR